MKGYMLRFKITIGEAVNHIQETLIGKRQGSAKDSRSPNIFKSFISGSALTTRMGRTAVVKFFYIPYQR